VKRELPGGYELDDDPARVDLEAVWAFLSTEAYWGRERTREVVERQIGDAARVVGLYLGDRLVGFARIWSDGQKAYLADVYVLREHRGRGLGVELVRAAVDEGPHRDLRWMLHTKDAHGLYAKFGFGSPSDRLLERPPARERGSSSTRT
jgi:GNAT superfamily N-acetyltransferase